MLELKRPLNGLKKNIYEFQDMSDNAINTFKVTDMPDKFLLGKNFFKLHLKEDILVKDSPVYIDIIDSFGSSIYYTVISDNLPNKERIIAVYIYDTTPVGECEVIIAGRLLTNQNTGKKLDFSTDPSSNNYYGIPNVAWRKVVQINPYEVENSIYFSKPPTVTYSEIRKPQYDLANIDRTVTTYSSVSSTATMYSNRGNLNTIESVEGKVTGHLIPEGTSSATFIPISPINNENEIASVLFTGFQLSSSMEGGRLYVNNIPIYYPKDAAITQSEVINYSGSFVKIIDSSSCYVAPPLYRILDYTDINGAQKTLVVDGFKNVSNFTASYYKNQTITQDSSSYSSYIKLQIYNSEPEVGSVKSINVKAKSLNSPGSFIDIGTFYTKEKNILTISSGSYIVTENGIEQTSLGNLRNLITPATYWTGSAYPTNDISFLNKDTIPDGVLFRCPTSNTVNDFSEMYLRYDYMPTIVKDTEYKLSFDMAYLGIEEILVPLQLDVYISGSEIETSNNIGDSVLGLIKNQRFGTYLGSIDAQKTKRHNPVFYFKAKSSGRVTPKFVHRSTGVVYSNIELSVRNEPGYSSNYIEIEAPLPLEFSSRAEVGINIDYYNSKNEKANYNTSLYGAVFEGSTILETANTSPRRKSISTTFKAATGFIQNGDSEYVTIPFDATILGWYIISPSTGSIVIDVKKSQITSFPPVNSIVGRDYPKLVSNTIRYNPSVTTWTSSIVSKDVLKFEVTGSTDVTYVNLVIDLLSA